MAEVPQAPPSQVPQYEWRNLSGLKTTLTWLFAANAVATVFLIAMLLRRLGTLDDLEDFGTSQAVRDDNRAADGVIAALGIWGLLAIFLVIFFITWFFRAAKNNEALGRTLPRFTSGWAIGGWFIPLANFVIPILIAQDLWRGSDPSTPRDDHTWRARPGSGLIAAWWATFLASRVSFFFGRGDPNDGDLTINELQSSINASLVGQVLTIIAAVLAILFVRRLTERQEECLRAQREAWGQQHGETPPA